MVRALDCGSRGPPFKPGWRYHRHFCNPAPDAEVTSVGQENFDWVVETSADYAIERAKKQKDGFDNLTWGEYVKTSAAKTLLVGASVKPVKEDVSVGKVEHPIEAEGKVKKVAKAKAPAEKVSAPVKAQEKVKKDKAVKEKPKKASKK